MFKYGQVSQGGLRVYDDVLPPLLSAEASYQMWLEIKAGALLHNALIEGNMRIAAAIAARYAQALPWAKYDLFSEAMLGLTEALQGIESIEFKEPGALRGFLRKKVHGSVGKFLAVCMNGYEIDTKQITRIQKGEDEQFKSLKDLTRINIVAPDDERSNAIINRMSVEQGREHLIDRMERLMKDSGLEEIEYRVMMFYLAGYTEEATAKELNVCRGTVHYRKQEAIEKMRYIFFDPSVDLESESL